ncbi:MAG: hypothetical protein KatS3mg023_0788 [Armatimonadota bacterium]|nr:MAG: hypothetical protein KatS3mg023_0788 [Armatimonadota bacterium]
MRCTTLWTWAGCLGLLCLMPLHAEAQKEPVPEQPDLRPYLLTEPRVLFTLRWGTGKGELPEPLEPGDWYGTLRPHIASDGSIYIGLRQFDRQGKLIRRVTLQQDPANAIETWQGSFLVVDPQSRIVVYLYGLGREALQIYGRDGKRLKKADALLQQAIQQALTLRADRTLDVFRLGSGLKCLPDGRVIVGDGYRVDLTTGAVDKVPEQSKVPLINLHRGYLYEVGIADPGVPGKKWYVYTTGEVHYSEVDWNEGTRYRITVYDDKGRLQRQLLLPSGELSEVEKLLPFHATLLVDGRGHFYLTLFPRVVYDVPVSKQEYQRYVGVVEYDREGRFVGLRAICEAFSAWNVSVDRDGNVYWLSPGKEGVKVMMAPVPQSTR